MITKLDHVTLIDGVRDTPLADAWVLVEADRIVRIGQYPEEARPADQTVDLRGCTLLPGLFNLHVHIQRRHLAARQQQVFRVGAAAVENAPDTYRIVWAMKNAWRELFSGVTTLRDCASKNRINNTLRDMIRSGIVKGPDILSCGFGIAATGGHETHRYQGAVEVDGPDEVRKAVRMEIKQGADFIKFMASGGIGGMPEHEDPSWVEMGLDELRAGIDEAHNRNKRTTVHAMGERSILRALEAGVDCIEHGVNLNEEALAMMKERRVFYVPTLSGITAVAEREQRSGSRELGDLIQRRVVEPLKHSIQLAAEQDITIGCGTDTFGDVITEMQLFHACGLSNMACVKTATANAARICGLEASRGTVEPGKLADLVIVDQNPLEDLEHLRLVRKVMKRGVLVDLDWAVQLQSV